VRGRAVVLDVAGSEALVLGEDGEIGRHPIPDGGVERGQEIGIRRTSKNRRQRRSHSVA